MSDKFAGANWLAENKSLLAGRTISPLGVRVADLLGDLLDGIYHLDNAKLRNVDWDNPHHMSVLIFGKDWATYDFDLLTRIVFLAHDYCVRVTLDPVRNGIMRVWFHDRQRNGDHRFEEHPYLEQALEAYRKHWARPADGQESGK